MDETVITFRIEDVEGGYTLAYAAAGSLTSVELPSSALDVSGLASFADDAAEGFATFEETAQWGSEVYRFLVEERPWSTSFEQEMEQSELVHVRLDTGSSALRTVLWELLYRDGFLALKPQVRLSRVGPSQPALRSLDQPLRVVVLTPNLADRESEQEADIVFEVLGPAQREGLVVAYEVRYQALSPLARVRDCDVLHVIGHADELLAYFQRLVALCQRVRPVVVYFSASRGGTLLDERSNLMSLLQREASVPVVVGLHEVTAASSSMMLAAEFYRGLTGGIPTAAAVARARRQMALALERSLQSDSAFDWAGLVVYQHDERGVAYAPSSRVRADVAAQPEAVEPPLQPVPPGSAVAPAASSAAAQSAAARGGADGDGSLAGETAASPEMEAASLPSVSLEDLWPRVEKEEAGLADGLREIFRAEVVGQEALDMLRDSLRSDDRRRQIAAVEALGIVAERQPQARDLLVDLAVRQEEAGADSLVRRKAVEQLGYLRDQVARSALLLAIADPDPAVRQAARSALARIGQQAGAEPQPPRARLPLGSAEASEWVAPLRQAVAGVPDLSPRQRVMAMKQVEALRLELMHPRPETGRVHVFLDALAAVAPPIATLAADIKGRLEFTALAPSPVPSGEGRAARASKAQSTGPGEGGAQ